MDSHTCPRFRSNSSLLTDILVETDRPLPTPTKTLYLDSYRIRPTNLNADTQHPLAVTGTSINHQPKSARDFLSTGFNNTRF